MTTKLDKSSIDFAVIYFSEGRASADTYPTVRRKRMYAGNEIIRFVKSALRYAEWVRKIFIAAADPLPEDPVFSDERVRIVSLSEFMPAGCADSVNINAIELNLHRISGLSEQFVYFNAGTYLCGKVSPSFFFRNGLPCDYAVEGVFETPDMYERHVLINDILQIKAAFNRNESLSYYRWKFLSPRYLRGMIRNAYFWFIRYYENGNRYRRGDFWGFEDHNYPLCTLKSICEKLWTVFPQALEETASRLTEDEKDVDHSLIRFYQYAAGLFAPCNWRSKTVMIEDPDTADSGELSRYRIAVLRTADDR